MASPQASTPSTHSQPDTPSDFWSLFRIEYPEKDKPQPGRLRKSSGPRYYVCVQCSNWSDKNRGNAVRHANNVHPSILRETEAMTSSQRSTDGSVIARTDPSALRNTFNRQRYIEAIVGLLTRRRVAFSAVEWDEMKDLALACNPAIEDLLITSRRTAMRHIDANFELYASQLREKLQTAQSLIHISSDLWTSPHRHAMLAVCTQWVDKDYKLQKALLGLPECRYGHSGERQAALIAETLRKFEISKVGYHTGDNATSNDTCLEALSESLREEHGVSLAI
jgi:hypothetical protein